MFSRCRFNEIYQFEIYQFIVCHGQLYLAVGCLSRPDVVLLWDVCHSKMCLAVGCLSQQDVILLLVF